MYVIPLRMIFKFENLLVWQKAMDLSDNVYQIAAGFPKEEIFILSSQIKRAANSVVLNIAEGSTDQSDAEFKRFLSIALRSNVEVVACLQIAKRRKYIDDKTYNKLSKDCEEILLMIIGLKKSLE